MRDRASAPRSVLVFALVLLAAHAGGQHHEGPHGNPTDLDGYMAHLLDPGRDSWQKPDQVVSALGLRPGQLVCDVGAGPGYFALRLAHVLGPRGLVYAVDVEPRILERLRDRLSASGIRNVLPVLALADDPLLPDGACDVVLVVDTYHHFPNRSAYLRRLHRALKPAGRLVNIDYHKRETPVGPPLAHRVSREAFLEEARQAGFKIVDEHGFLPHQYFLVLRAR